jgi:hypothetical protein
MRKVLTVFVRPSLASARAIDTLMRSIFTGAGRMPMADLRSDETAARRRSRALLAGAVAVALGLAGAFVLGRSVAPSGTSAVGDARSARFVALLRSLDLDADQRARADRLFAGARREADTIRDEDARRVAYRALMRQAMTTLRGALNADQRAALDAARAREAAAEASSERAEKARLGQLVASLALNAEQRTIAAPLFAHATGTADAAAIDKAGVLDAGYRCAFFALASALDPDQKAKLDVVLRPGGAVKEPR